jgi:hypothetical protein
MLWARNPMSDKATSNAATDLSAHWAIGLLSAQIGYD